VSPVGSLNGGVGVVVLTVTEPSVVVGPQQSGPFGWRGRRVKGAVIMDLLLALAFVVLAYVLGLAVHPVLWLVVIAPAIWLVASHDGRSRVRA
jgi:hypothetical protein